MSINSRDAISFRKWSPPFLTQVSVSYVGRPPKIRVSKGKALLEAGWGKARGTYVKRAKLDVGVFVANTLLEGPHSL